MLNDDSLPFGDEKRDGAGDVKLELMKPLAFVSPFIGYLVAYLLELGHAAYFRIPTPYVSIGIGDALSAGCVLIILSVASIAIYKYLKGNGVWQWKKDRSSRKILYNAKSDAKDFPWYTSYVIYHVIYYLAKAVPFILLFVLVLLFGFVMLNSFQNLGGRDVAAFGLILAGFIVLLVGSVYLYKAESGKAMKEAEVPGGFSGLKNKHVVFGLVIVIILGGICYCGGYFLATIPQAYLVSQEKNLVIVKQYGSNNTAVIAEYEPTDDEHVIRLTGLYSYASTSEGYSSDADQGGMFRWKNLKVKV